MTELKKQNVTDMTSGSPTKQLIFFALPLIFGNFLQQFYTIVDTIVVGRGVGIEALAALGASDWINWLILWMIQGLTQGFAILIAQYFGAGDHASLRKTISMSTILCLVLGVIMTAIGLLAAQPVLSLLNTPENIMAGSWTYLRVIFSGTLVITAYNMASSILRSLGDSKTPLIAMGIAACINILLDLLFVMVFRWGITGAAVATVLAQVFSFLYCLQSIRKIQILQMKKSDWQIDAPLIKNLLRLGLPLGLSQGVIAIGGMVVQFVVNGYGFLFVAGFTATNKLYGVLECTAISFGFSISTYMGQNYGAKRLDRIKLGMRKMLQMAVGVSVVISVCMLLFGKFLVGLFVSGSAEQAGQVIAIAYQYLVIMSIFLAALYLLHIYRAALQGLGNAAAPTMSCFVELAMRVGVALLLPLLIGEQGIFFAEIAAWSGAAILLLVSYYLEIRKIAKRFAA